jgi:hypothetical protein
MHGMEHVGHKYILQAFADSQQWVASRSGSGRKMQRVKKAILGHPFGSVQGQGSGSCEHDTIGFKTGLCPIEGLCCLSRKDTHKISCVSIRVTFMRFRRNTVSVEMQ